MKAIVFRKAYMDDLVIIGNMTHKQIRKYKLAGWSPRNANINKNGIVVVMGRQRFIRAANA